ncbi:acetyl-CoA carboxylase biotin carboxylase subunit [Roseomonas sp. GCM10028921]
MFTKILIANRGEIACRVIATARRMGIATVAVFSKADARARHVQLADEAWPVGPAPARESYLRIEHIIEAARRSGAQAIHPGYGFLSENAEFAAACVEAGIAFIGPPVEAIRAMGSKAASKTLMEEAGVPLVPGYHGENQDPELLAAEAARIDFPVLVKASAGGGGKGMRVVERAEDFAEALAGAAREAASSFGDARVLIEKYLQRPRHIEIQVFADTHGNTVSLFERDCSVQRRHQKVLEEAPAPGMDPARRAAMGRAACDAARAVGYVGAGTVEFIAEGNSFYFMEMNTRLQVEHPVTEMVTGLDLVEWQLRVAGGEPLPLREEELRLQGHAIEARIYAEDPARDFLPSTGTLHHLRQPRETPDVRVDTGVRAGDAITPYYDPMIAKLICRGADRPAALRQLRAALAEYEVIGVRTNLGLLRAVAAHSDFTAGRFDTGFIARHPEVMAEATPLAEERGTVLAAAAMALLRAEGVPADPWSLRDAWRLNGDPWQELHLSLDGEEVVLRAHALRDGTWRLDLPGGWSPVAGAEPDGDALRLRLDGVERRVTVLRLEGAIGVAHAGRTHTVLVTDPLAPPGGAEAGSERVVAPIPARVVRVLVSEGEAVSKGAALLVLEAMKTELTLRAPADGRVESLRAAVGEMVEEGAQLVTFAAE